MDLDSKMVPLNRHPLGFIECFTQLGANLHDILAGTGIVPALLNRRDSRISYRQQKQLLANGLRHCPPEGLGLRVGLMYDWSFWGPAGYMVYCSPSLKAVGEAIKHYVVASQPLYVALSSRPNSFMDSNQRIVEPLDYPIATGGGPELIRFAHEFRLAITCRLWDMCGNKAVDDPRVHVQLGYAEPSYSELFQQLPCTSIMFNCPASQISAHAAFVLQPFRLFRKQAFQALVQQCEEELNRGPVPIPFPDRVRWHMRAHFNRKINLDSVSSAMQMTPRSLSRRLAAEGVSFRQLLHSVRMELAAHHLRASNLSVDEVSDMLGFSCASSLRRAVKNWSGNTISGIRADANPEPQLKDETPQELRMQS